MKKNTISALLLCGLLVGANSMKAQAVEQGNILVTGYVGGPNLLSILLKTLTKSGTITDGNGNVVDVTGLKTGGLIPVGVRAEYMLSDHFGLGLDGSYANSSLSFSGDDGNGGTANIKVSFPRPRVLAMANYHFGKGMADFYFGGGLGYAKSLAKPIISGSSTDPDVQEAIDEAKATLKSAIAVPIGGRLHFGTNIFFSDYVGLNLEIGAGGPMLKGGICAKF